MNSFFIFVGVSNKPECVLIGGDNLCLLLRLLHKEIYLCDFFE